MRNAFRDSLLAQAERPDFVFLTGDLGYGALEPLRDRMGPRFINAGVAEQNMISVAAGLSKGAFRPWVYSIAPFLYARPFEQIRNDVCLHGFPVVMVGNGGGYGYGVMGATHHALEDYGTLLTLLGLQVYIPAFDADLPLVVAELFESDKPAYLRLGVQEQPADWTPPPFASWRKLTSGGGPTVIAVGPLAGWYWGAWNSLAEDCRPNLWCVSRLPISELPAELWHEIRTAGAVGVAEEHVAHGSFGSMLASLMVHSGCVPRRYHHFVARGYPSGRYGSQRFHREECGLVPEQVLQTLTS
jgi:transketolase